jgi:hypothetical protein
MQVYDQEIKDGVSDLVDNSIAVCYASLIEPATNATKHKNFSVNKSIASINDSDLYYVQSILVSTSWNKNDDIFDKKEVWLAKDTPEDKPTNLDHNEEIIIGHITSNYPITEDGILIDIATPTDNLPEKFHILTGAVIYKGFTNPDLRNRAEKLIAEIESGIKYVSMECYFKNFDYGLVNKSTGEYSVLPRNNETAFLTKHLRSYGGLGEHENYKIGRVLRHITFSGKGYVDKPANPDSIIFNTTPIIQEKSLEEKKDDFVKAGVSFTQSSMNTNTEINIMSSENKAVDNDTQAQAMSDCAAATQEAYTLVEDLKNQISTLESVVQAKENELTAAKTAYTELAEKIEAAKKMSEEDMMKKEEEIKKTKSDLDAALEAVAVYKTKEVEMMKKEKKMKRASALIEAGIDQSVADETAEKLESLEDDAFASFTSLLLNATKSRVSTESLEKETSFKESTVAEVLETAEVEPTVDLSVGGEEDSMQNTRAALVDFVYSRLNKKNLNKGE